MFNLKKAIIKRNAFSAEIYLLRERLASGTMTITEYSKSIERFHELVEKNRRLTKKIDRAIACRTKITGLIRKVFRLK